MLCQFKAIVACLYRKDQQKNVDIRAIKFSVFANINPLNPPYQGDLRRFLWKTECPTWTSEPFSHPENS